MEFHIHAKSAEISRYVFCPGHQNRAKRIADHLQTIGMFLMSICALDDLVCFEPVEENLHLKNVRKIN